jgi:hypothetical protein
MHIYNIHVQTSCKAKMFHIRETIRFSHNKVGWFMVWLGAVMVVIMVVNLQLPVQAGAITIKFVSSNSIQVGGFLRVLRFPLQIKLTTTICFLRNVQTG